MNISEFARSRGIEPQTVRHYVNDHEDIKKHTKKVGKMVELSDEAIELLDKIYPLPKPIQIMTGVDPDEHKRVQTELEIIRKKYDATLEKITVLQDKMMEDQKLIAQAEAQKILLEDKNSQLEAARSEVENKDTEIKDLRAELERLKNRSFIDRLFNK